MATRTSSKNEPNSGKPRSRDREVLDAAAAVFGRRGYAAATVQEVADELGILKGSIYYYTKTKEDLLFRLLTEVHDEVDGLLDEVRAIDDIDALERLQIYVRRQIEQNLKSLVKIRVYYNDLEQLGDERRAAILKRQKIHGAFVTDLIRQGQAEGSIDPTHDARLLSHTVFAVIIWPYRWYHPGGRRSIKSIADACVDTLVRGLSLPAGA